MNSWVSADVMCSPSRLRSMSERKFTPQLCATGLGRQEDQCLRREGTLGLSVAAARESNWLPPECSPSRASLPGRDSHSQPPIPPHREIRETVPLRQQAGRLVLSPTVRALRRAMPQGSLRRKRRANNCCIRSRVRSMRLMVLMASTLVALVKIAGATMKVSTANGLCVNEFGPIYPPEH